MVHSLVTILIPSNNSALGLKTTVESALLQTKIKGTSLIVLDYGSNDGSVQYAAHASSEHFKTLKIEVVDLKVNSFNCSINSPYVLFLKPGFSFENNDFLLDSLNICLKEKCRIFFYKAITKNPLAKFLPKIFGYGKNFSIEGVLCPTENFSEIKTNIEENLILFEIDSASLKQNYKGIRIK